MVFQKKKTHSHSISINLREAFIFSQTKIKTFLISVLQLKTIISYPLSLREKRLSQANYLVWNRRNRNEKKKKLSTCFGNLFLQHGYQKRIFFHARAYLFRRQSSCEITSRTRVLTNELLFAGLARYVHSIFFFVQGALRVIDR